LKNAGRLSLGIDFVALDKNRFYLNPTVELKRTGANLILRFGRRDLMKFTQKNQFTSIQKTIETLIAKGISVNEIIESRGVPLVRTLLRENLFDTLTTEALSAVKNPKRLNKTKGQKALSLRPLRKGQPMEKFLTTKSFRDFGGRKIDIDILSQALTLALSRRIPAAGGFADFKFFLAAHSVIGLPNGIYDLKKKSLFKISDERKLLAADETFVNAATGKRGKPQAVIWIAAKGNSLFDTYGPYSQSLILMNAGILIDRLYLVTNFLKIPGCAIGKFSDTENWQRKKIISKDLTVICGFAV
jgi:SagB-type dehydrogenase family enzyme